VPSSKHLDAPIQLWGIDLVGRFPKYNGVPWGYILVVVDHFSRFVWAFLCVTDDQPEVIRCLTTLFEQEGISIGCYLDPGPYFGEATQAFVRWKVAL